MQVILKMMILELEGRPDKGLELREWAFLENIERMAVECTEAPHESPVAFFRCFVTSHQSLLELNCSMPNSYST